MAKKRRSNRKVHRGRKKRGFSTWSLGKKIGVIAVSILLVLVIGGGAAAAAYVTSKVDKMEVQKLDVNKLEINKEVEHKTGYLNVALFGVDSREASLGKGTRSDTIMIASLNQETGEVKISSVYRDTILQQSDGTYNKANAAYSFGGVEEAVALLNKNLDLNIEHYVAVNFNAMIDVIDTLGGLDIELTEEEVKYTNMYCDETAVVTGRPFEEDLVGAGVHHLDGVQATSFCRIRYTKGDDFKRTERQRFVIEKIVEKLQAANLATINKIADDVFAEVGTNFTLPEILSYAKDFKKYTLGETTGFPFNKSTGTLSGIGSSVLPTDLAGDVQQLHQFFFGDDGYTPSDVVLSIDAGVKKKATDVGKGTTKIMTVITMTAPTVLLRVHQEVVPINLQELQVEAPVAAIPLAVEAPVAVNQTADQAAAPVAEVQAAVPVAEVNLAEAVLAAAVPVEEVNLVEAAPAAENLPVVKVQNNV